MCPYNAYHFVLSKKLFSQRLPKVNRTLPRFVKFCFCHHVPVLIIDRVWPNEIAEGAFQRYFREPINSVNFFNLISRIEYVEDFVADSSMNTEEFFIHQAGQRQMVKCCHEFFINILIVLFYGLNHEVVETGHAPWLMIASKQEDFFWAIDL